MRVWEPRNFTRDRYLGGTNAAILPDGARSRSSIFYNNNVPGRAPLSPEIAELNRYGIGYPYLYAAVAKSRATGVPVLELLFRSGTVSREIWLDDQTPLNSENPQHLVDQAVNNLRRQTPHYSAAHTVSAGQILFLGAAAAFGLGYYTIFPDSAFATGFLLLAVFYFASVVLRGLLLAAYEGNHETSQNCVYTNDRALPVYSVLVALYHESGQIKELTGHLRRLDWPKDRLEIKLICEADDLETIQAIKQENLPAYFKLIIVPPALPRTKPKALNYALPGAYGKYLVIYDAEDRPSPGQLREAHAKFSVSDAKLACLQAPLLIHNAKQSWLTRMFAIEYVTLFNGILPILAKWRVPLPLGGTSNHFKTAVLKSVGGWDPYNVTEDADLGIRLFREGYRCGTLKQPTYEEAPPNLGPWISQRTRWLKGWMQTILVHSRNPVQLARDIGIKNTLAMHLILTSIVLSALIHPIFLITSIQQLLNLGTDAYSGFDAAMLAGSVFNLVGGYTTYGLLGFAVLRATGNGDQIKLLLTLPLYWLLISYAGWRALWHLVTKPHQWEKTPHGLANHNFSLHKKEDHTE